MNPRPGSQFRLKFGFLVIAIVLSFYGARLVQLQAIDPGSYSQIAYKEGLEQVVLPASRGEIEDRNGVAMAASMDGLMVIADPFLTAPKAPQLAKFLADRLGVDYFATLEKLRKTTGDGKRYQIIAHRIPATKVRKALADAADQGFQGLSTERDPIRAYPLNDVGANVVGFIGQDDENGPLAGLERTFNKQLAGADGEARYIAVKGRQVPLSEAEITEPRDGRPLRLTLDSDAQWFTQRTLAAAVRNWKAASGVAIVMDSHTGELLAYADYPSFDANDPQATDKEYYGSKGVQDPYEPGSVEKVLTLSSVMDSGHATPETRLTVPDVLMRDNWPIHDHGRQGTVKLTLAGVLSRSSNIGTTLSAETMEPSEIRDYLAKFGLGQRTNVGLRGESAGVVPAAPWSDIQRATISYGQGMTVTPLQMIAAVNTIANGGVRVSPSLIEGTATTDTGVKVGTSQATATRVLSADTAEKMSRMMETVLDPEEGTAPLARIPGYRVAGKTGTAQVNENGKYLDNLNDNSFVGFAPADNPRFTVYVVLRHVNGGAGGLTAGPAFKRIMSYMLRKYGIPPTDTTATPYETTWGGRGTGNLQP
ncbi:peptidoglycan D,D-transpeptidase FtsI family protein [Nocardioides jiangxiensis]|uniref:Penicillin-binding protein 2 n=1 Tax=Nocardioides jiangxiensis TaxID=3064524 RepID=A0ABT9B7S3_9ACTN|nr:penicillin-binding protein 2 [Nocardioides sp. WY-20]MDO7869341.1 penicillin-binding protein 2 [Nocardioides sp. WY-20]